MIKKFIDRLLGTGSAGKHRFGKRREVPRSEHGIDVSLVDERAVHVVRSLQDAGYEAYIVGGAVRDLLPPPSRSRACFAGPSSSAAGFASSMWSTAAAASMR